MSLATLLLILCGLAELSLICWLLPIFFLPEGSYQRYQESSGIKTATVFFGLCALSLLLGWITWQLLRISDRASSEAEKLPYVPPVTADALPVEEVLVRASAEPDQEQSRVLLRVADGSSGAGEQELLRSSQAREQRP